VVSACRALFRKVKRLYSGVFRDSKMPKDDDLEMLKRRKLLELQRRMLRETKKPEELPPPPKEPTTDEVFSQWFVGRSWEILRTARVQFPQVMPKVEDALVNALKSGRIKQKIDGGSLFQFLRQIGVPVRLQTTIKYSEHGELKSIGQVLKEK
jgi:DNA-binding TFAR19-related protein (PDSD5 family)